MSAAETPTLSRATLELIASQLRIARSSAIAALEAANTGLQALAPLLGPSGAAPGQPGAPAAAVAGPPRRLRREDIHCFGGQTIGPDGATVATPAAPATTAEGDIGSAL